MLDLSLGDTYVGAVVVSLLATEDRLSGTVGAYLGSIWLPSVDAVAIPPRPGILLSYGDAEHSVQQGSGRCRKTATGYSKTCSGHVSCFIVEMGDNLRQ